MKILPAITLLVGVLSFPPAVSTQTTVVAGGRELTASGRNSEPANALLKDERVNPGVQLPLKTAGCGGCAQDAASTNKPVEVVSSRPIPGSNESMVVGRIENLIPIGVMTVLGCEKCAEEVVTWALQQGSSFEDVEHALRTVAAMQKLDCFNQKFGPEVAGRIERPLAAARKALEQAMAGAGK